MVPAGPWSSSAPPLRVMLTQALRCLRAAVLQVDLAGLLAAHERRRLAAYRRVDDSSASSSLTSSSESLSCRSSSDEECEGLASHSLGHAAGRGHDILLKANPAIPAERLGALASYTRHYLYSLPPLYLAVARGHATLVYLLLKYGASVDFQVSHRAAAAIAASICPIPPRQSR